MADLNDLSTYRLLQVATSPADEETATFLLPSAAQLPKRRYDTSHHVLATIGHLAILLLPSFIHCHFQPNDSTFSEKKKLAAKRSTDYLNGIRGVASLVVFIFHYTSEVHPEVVNNGYGQGDNWSLLQLPIIRIFFGGAAMVSVFFVVSGYVLSHRCLTLIRSRSYSDLVSTLTSLTFRRAMRLFIPSFTSSFLAYLFVVFGFLKPPTSNYQATFLTDTTSYIHYLDDFLFNVWTWKIDYHGYYNAHLWTIVVEYRCSMVLFLMILGLARCRTMIRLILEAGITLHCFLHVRWDVALFSAGMMIAEVNIIYESKAKTQDFEVDDLPEIDRTRRKVSVKSIARVSILVFCLMLGIYLAGYPRDHANKTPGYMFLSSLWPYKYSYKRRFWHAQAAILIVSSISFLPICQKIFTTRVARYLGKISYALYLVHGLMNRTFGRAITSAVWNIVGRDGWWAYNGGWALASLVYVPCVFWVADLFWRGIDIPAVRFARWIERMCFVRY
ncbi:hypothetical protein MMC12_003373 [Toensbergia leucococca]|nr:hypothetical protein [Toensbergia leucococca]